MICTQLRILGIVSHRPLEMLRPLKDLKRIEISPFELKDTVVALMYTNPWKTSNKINPSYCSKLVYFVCNFNFLDVILYLFIYLFLFNIVFVYI